MLVFVNCNCTDSSKRRDIISVGCITTSGDKFYGEIKDIKEDDCDDTVKDMILPSLKFRNLIPQRSFSESNTTHFYGEKEVLTVTAFGTSFEVEMELLKFLKKISDLSLDHAITFVSDFSNDYAESMILDFISNYDSEVPEHVNPTVLDLTSMIFLNRADNGFDTAEEDAIFMDRYEMLEIDPYGISKDYFNHSLWKAYITMLSITKICDFLHMDEIDEKMEEVIKFIDNGGKSRE